MYRLFLIFIFCFINQACDQFTSVDIKNESDQVAIIEIDFNSSKLEWSDEYQIYYDLNFYPIDSPSTVVIDSVNLIYQFKIQPHKIFELDGSLGLKPDLDFIERLSIIKPYRKSYYSENEIYADLVETKTRYFQLRIK